MKPPDKLLRQLYRYDPATGTITGPGKRYTSRGYRMIGLPGFTVLSEHQLAFYLMTGVWSRPGTAIDHIDRDRANNRWKNLRHISAAENQRNRKGQRPYSGFPEYADRSGVTHP